MGRLPSEPTATFGHYRIYLRATAAIVKERHAVVPAASVKDLIALAKGSPGKLNYGLAGSGNAGRLAGELFKMRYGLNIIAIPYRGGGR